MTFAETFFTISALVVAAVALVIAWFAYQEMLAAGKVVEQTNELLTGLQAITLELTISTKAMSHLHYQIGAANPWASTAGGDLVISNPSAIEESIKRQLGNASPSSVGSTDEE